MSFHLAGSDNIPHVDKWCCTVPGRPFQTCGMSISEYPNSSTISPLVCEVLRAADSPIVLSWVVSRIPPGPCKPMLADNMCQPTHDTCSTTMNSISY